MDYEKRFKELSFNTKEIRKEQGEAKKVAGCSIKTLLQ